ncbi:MAG: hypothetical protein EOP54_22130 [Sphingobacteriales bacterium]|nr:MAG: hypothetical protein EOP54_22130 [Sphingobacteriales bacterium]
MLKVVFFCSGFLYTCAAFAIDEKREYKVERRTLYFYFLEDTLFLETLTIDKPVRYKVDTFFRIKADSNSFYSGKRIIRFESVGHEYLQLIIKENTLSSIEIKYSAKPVSGKEKVKWNRLYNNVLIGRYYQKVAAVKQTTDPLNNKLKTWNSIHQSLQELNQDAEKYEQQEFEAEIRAIFKEMGVLNVYFV